MTGRVATGCFHLNAWCVRGAMLIIPTHWQPIVGPVVEPTTKGGAQ